MQFELFRFGVARSRIGLAKPPVMSEDLFQVMLKRRNTGILSSPSNAEKKMAARKVPRTTPTGKRVMADPVTASVAAISRSATEQTISQMLGGEPHKR